MSTKHLISRKNQTYEYIVKLKAKQTDPDALAYIRILDNLLRCIEELTNALEAHTAAAPGTLAGHPDREGV